MLAQKQLLVTDTTFRDAHQSLLATRVRSFDMLAVADAVARRTAAPLLARNVGRRHVRHRDALPARGPVGAPARVARAHPEHLLPDALPRQQRRRLLELSAQCRRRFRETRRRQRHRHFPDIRFPQLHTQPQGRHGGRARHARHLRGGHLLHGRYPRSGPLEVLARILHQDGEGTGAHGRAHPRHQGHGRPLPPLCGARAGQGAAQGDWHPDPFPHARHQRHQRRLGAPGERCRGRYRRPGHRLDERLDLPAEPQFHRRRAPAHQARHRPGPRGAQ